MKKLLFTFASLTVLGLLGASACSDDDTTTVAGPKAPPGLSLVAVEGIGGPRWEPGKDACIELGADVDQTVVVTIAVSDFVLRPPGTCGSARQCGTALLRVDPSGDSEALKVQAAQTTLAAKLATLGAGQHTFRVELRDQDGDPVIDKEAGATLFSEIALEVKSPGGCSGATDAGTDAPSEAASDAPSEAEPDAPSDASDAGIEAGTDAADATTDVTAG